MNSIKEHTKKHASKIVASVITLSIITLLILAGPAGALVLNLDNFSNSNPTQGTSVSSSFTITINSNERMGFPNPIGIFMDGSSSALCSFSVDGSSSDCASKGITVSLVSSSTDYGYGWGYGYGYSYGYGYQNGYSKGILTYQITLDTNQFSVGTHSIKLMVNTGDSHIYSSNEKQITINARSGGGSTIPKNSSATAISINQQLPALTPLANKGTGGAIIDNTPKSTITNAFTNFLNGAVTGITNFGKSPTGITTIIILFTSVIGGIVFFSFRKGKFRK